MPPKLKQLINLLNDGQFHSGETLGEHFSISRAAVWKMIQQLQTYHLPLESSSGKGYALQAPIEWLERDKMEVHLDAPIQQMINDWFVFDTVDSTSHYLMDSAAHHNSSVQICIAEHQSGGYGRRKQGWVAPLGHNIYLSVSWHTETDIQDLSGLNIALGVALVKALKKLGIQAPLGLKWPNDIFSQNKKLAGLLIETRCTGNDLCHIVASCGLNTFIPDTLKQSLDKPITDLTSLGEPIKRNALAGALINAMLHTLKDWTRKLPAETIREWARYDICKQKEIWVEKEQNSFSAFVMGVDPAGRLLIKKSDGSLEALSAGNFSIKVPPHQPTKA